MKKKDSSTSWEPAEKWYNQCVGEKGHYYHQSEIIPSTLRLLEIDSKTTGSFLDIGCGQGVLARHLPSTASYVGVDLSAGLIRDAKKQAAAHQQFFVADATKPLILEKKNFDRAAMILCLQNMENGLGAIQNCANYLKKGGKLLIVLNHPCFRIPRQSSWEIDEAMKLQYRRMNLYMTPQTIPIQTNPGSGNKSSVTYSFHHPLSTYVQWFAQCGLAIQKLEEWCSDKKSEGGKSRMENRARKEFPLFLAMLCAK